MNETTELVATCLFGLERLLGEEIEALGYKRIETIDGRVIFAADLAGIARCNINLRFAERVYIRLGTFRADSFNNLFEGVRALPWERWIGKTDAFPVKGHSIKSALTSIPDCQKIVKKAVCKRLESTYGIERFEETGTLYQIEFFILNDMASLMIDTSGTPLHKRGYRPESVDAPLRETLAAALVSLSRPRENVELIDPFCGSGTIAIEAALMMTNTAPGLRRSFASEKFSAIPKDVWGNARAEAYAAITPDTAFRTTATDIDPEAVKIAKDNIERAGMTKYIDCYVKDALTLTNDGRRATIVCNPPYGERIFTPEQTEKLYVDMGKCFAKLAPWQIYIITSNEEFERLYGRKADKVRKLYNGMIKCSYYQYFKNQNKQGRT